MKTTKMNIKKLVLIGLLIPTLGTITGCSSNNNKGNNDKKIVETKPNELTIDETRKLKNGDIVPEGKDVNRELLEQQDMDYMYVYYTYRKTNAGVPVKNSERNMYSYTKYPAEAEVEGTNGQLIAYYELLRKEIINIEFVKDQHASYKKKLIVPDSDFPITLVDVIDENNINKDKVKTK